jgi:glycosyltransferase involved in cell wall biosynthesis
VPADLAVILTARNEADRIGATLAALRATFPEADVVVADDASDDATRRIAEDAGARVVRASVGLGKGGAATLAAGAVDARVVLFADADLGESARELAELVDVLGNRDADATADAGGAGASAAADPPDLVIAAFSRKEGGGFGIAVGAARRAIRSATGREMQAPISGQRAMRREVLDAVLPFAPGFGMETGMTIDAIRAGFRVVEVELDLEHRATGRTPRGFAHRARQLRDIVRAYASRRS